MATFHELGKCPDCGDVCVYIISDEDNWRVKCEGCGSVGPEGNCMQKAADLWNEIERD